jgi:hypothetical protein
MKFISFVLVNLLMFFSVAHAQNSSTMERGFILFSVQKNRVDLVGGSIFVGSSAGSWTTVRSKGYPQLTCLPGGGRDLTSVQLASGYKVTADVVGENLAFDVAEWIVEEKTREINALQVGGACTSYAPIQKLLFQRLVNVPYVSTTTPQILDLGNGNSLKWTLRIDKI